MEAGKHSQGRNTKALRMEKSSKRGKIPPQDWPSIITRYQAGETLASIARTYDCSPPAISYIVSRTRARNAAVDAPIPAAPAEPQLVKSQPPDTPVPATPTTGLPPSDSPPSAGGSATPAVTENPGARAYPAPQQEALRLFSDDAPPAPPQPREPARQGEDVIVEPQGQRPHDPPGGSGNNGPRSPASAAGTAAPGEPRRTLHLSLSGGDAGHRHEREAHAPAPHNPFVRGVGERAPPPQTIADPAVGTGSGPYPSAGNGGPAATQPAAAAKEAGAFIDKALRERVADDVAAFLAAFDAALNHDSAESRTGLREATDRLLRAGARTRIELERLEARVPLASRETGGQEGRGFRPR
jgi:hypothetical protein